MSSYNKFIASKLILEVGHQTIIANVGRAWVEFNNSSSGKINLYKYLETLPNVSKTKTMFKGLSIKQDIVAPLAHRQMTAYEEAMLEIEKQKLEQQDRLKEKELASQDRLKDKEIASQDRLKEKELASQERMKEKELEQQERFKQMDKEEKEKDRLFMQQENNKNRALFTKDAGYNKYLDGEFYGTPSRQYITKEGAIAMIGYSVYEHSNHMDSNTIEYINECIEEVIEEVPVIDHQLNTIHVEACEVKQVIDKLDAFKEKVMSEQDILNKLMLDGIKEIKSHLQVLQSKLDKSNTQLRSSVLEKSIDECCRTKKVENVFAQANMIVGNGELGEPTSSLNDLSTVNAKGGAHISKYLRSINRVRADSDSILYACCCVCGVEYKLSDMERCHDIPRSVGGSWEKKNIFVGCKTCNREMGNKESLRQFKANRYDKLLMSLSL